MEIFLAWFPRGSVAGAGFRDTPSCCRANRLRPSPLAPIILPLSHPRLILPLNKFWILSSPKIITPSVYTSGGSFIQSVSFDLRADSNSFFDFDGDVGSLNSQATPVLGTLTGLTSGDIGFIFTNLVSGIASHPATLTFTFAPGSFGPGDAFSWGADTEFFVRDVPTPGGVFGEGGAIFAAVLESGQSSSLPFFTINEFVSVAAISICPCPVPLPPALLLFGSGLLGVWGLQRRQKNS